MSRKISGRRFEEFVRSPDTFRVYKGRRLLYSSQKDRLVPVLEYIETHKPYEEGVTVYDRVVGNAAALFLVMVHTRSVFSELGSKNAIRTLDAAGIKYRFNETVDCIMNDSGQDMCPMERLSLGKTPEEFYQALKSGGKR